MFGYDNSNIYLLFYALAWATALYSYWKKKKLFGSGILIIISYLFYAIVSVALYNNPLALGDYAKLTFFPFVYLFSVLLICLQPVLRYNEHSVIVLPSISLINTISWIIVIVTVLTLPNVLGHIREGVLMILTTEGGGAELYNQSRIGEQVQSSLWNYFYAFSNITSDISVLFLFFYLTLQKKKQFLLFGLVVGVFTSILGSLSSGLRTEATMKILIIFGSYYLFKDHLSKKTKRVMTISGSILLSLVFLVMIALTISRFSSFEGGTDYQVERYIGQANLNFNNYCLDAGGIRHGDRTCNTFKRILGFDNVPRDVMETRARYSTMKINDGSFYTFVGDFTLDFGPIWGGLILLFSSVILCRLTRPHKKGVIYFHQLLLVYFSMSVCIQGGMYLFYYSFKQNFVIIAYFLLYLLFYWDYYSRIKKASF